MLVLVHHREHCINFMLGEDFGDSVALEFALVVVLGDDTLPLFKMKNRSVKRVHFHDLVRSGERGVLRSVVLFVPVHEVVKELFQKWFGDFIHEPDAASFLLLCRPPLEFR